MDGQPESLIRAAFLFALQALVWPVGRVINVVSLDSHPASQPDSPRFAHHSSPMISVGSNDNFGSQTQIDEAERQKPKGNFSPNRSRMESPKIGAKIDWIQAKTMS